MLNVHSAAKTDMLIFENGLTLYINVSFLSINLIFGDIYITHTDT